MQRLNLTLPTAAENVALDEALLEWAEEGATGREVLRIWESPQPIVVAGRSSRVEQEINTEECDRRGIPIVRRSSGGAAIVAGPGCLMYAVVISYDLHPDLRDISRAHAFVLDRLKVALNAAGAATACAGTSDLVISDCGTQRVPGIVDCKTAIGQSDVAARKFSGNSLRVKRTQFLYHGTLLYNFDLELIATCLRTAPRQPKYREGRSHSDFVANLPLNKTQVTSALDDAFPTSGDLKNVPLARVQELVATRFGQNEWNRKFG